MLPASAATTNPCGISQEQLSALIGRILTSQHFARTRRLQSFLKFVCERAHAQRYEEISEQHVGHLVFGRDQHYNPSEDNIVRVEARELRKRLEAYFTQEGAQEPVIIEIPRGSYVPVFSARRAEAAPAAVETAPPVVAEDHRPWRLVRMLAAVIGALALFCGWLWIENRSLASHNRPPEIVGRFWSRVLTAERPTLVAVGDSSFALLQDLRRESASFEDYMSGAFFSNLRSRQMTETDRLLGSIATRSHTSLADAVLFARITKIAPPGSHLSLRFAREVRAQDLKTNNMVFIGSERANPWSGLFKSWRNFQFQYDAASNRASFLNRQPRSGEPPAFVAGPLGPSATEAYGTIAFLPSLDHSGLVVILAGTSMQGSEAAGDYLTRPEKLEELARALGADPAQPLPYFEAMVKLIAVDASSVSTQIVACRVIDPSKLEAIRYTQP